LQFNRGFAYAAAVLFLISVRVGTWVYFNDFRAVHVSQWLVLSLFAVSFGMYIMGRSDFLNHTKRLQAVPILLAVFGVFMFFYGGFISLFALDGVEFSVYEPLVLQVWPYSEGVLLARIFDLMLSSLWVIAGVFLVADWVRPPPRGTEWAMLAATAFLVFWNVTLFEAHTGGSLGHGLLSYFLGYFLYLIVSAGLALVTIMGVVMFFGSFVRRGQY